MKATRVLARAVACTVTSALGLTLTLAPARAAESAPRSSTAPTAPPASAAPTTHAAPANAEAPLLRPFVQMKDPPPVQVLVPGFVVRELPVSLPNLNNLAYGPDERLYAYAFDGKIHRLEDTDGDGLEDKASVFYANERGVIGTVGMRWAGDGLYVASRQQVMRLHDRGDGTAEVKIVSSGWAPPDTLSATSRYLDVYGLAVDRAGNVFFGLGISDIRNAYRLDPETKQSKYTRTWDRGTIQMVAPDGRREIVATGLRFTVSLAFNAAGDLFATDQEGATWLYNGNPFDELLHIQRGRHYGFPPRHPQHLPDVIDEPSVFDYGPQHQATCSVNFNEPAAAGAPLFGPDWWRGHAFTTGSARGRLERTTLVKTAAGYVARNDTIAYLAMMPIDAVPTPTGDLIVCCHSGRPDWGSGPTGIGKIYKISYRDRAAPQPVFAYAASPTETRMVFDRPLDAAQVRALTQNADVTLGMYVSGGDRFESLRPGYQAVKDQQKAPRFQLPVREARLDAGRNALALHTAPRVSGVGYSIALRETDRGRDALRPHDKTRRELPQQATLDLAADLTGVTARWRDAQGSEQWSGWLPHPDLTVARAFTQPSAEHRRLFARLRERGTLELQAQLDLSSMLHPLVQPGAKLDFEYRPENVRVRFRAANALTVTAPAPAKARRLGEHEWEIALDRATTDWLPLTLSLATGGEMEPSLDVSWSTTEDDRPRALPLRRVFLPWAQREQPAPVVREIPEIAGGDWQRGRELFFGKATCALCHQINGKGDTFGPDLSNLVYRDYASVLRDIIEPNATLNPDYIAVTLELKKGETAGGILAQTGNTRYVLAQPNGVQQNIPFDDVKPGTLKPLGTSLMPPGLLDALNTQERKDLLTFLLTVAPGVRTP